MFVHDAREGLRLAGEHHHGGFEIHFRRAETDDAVRQIPVKRHGHAELPANFLIGAAHRAAIIEIPRSRFGMQARQAAQARAFFRRGFDRGAGQLCQPFARDYVVRIDFQRLPQQGARVGDISGHRLALGRIDQSLNQLKSRMFLQDRVFPSGA